VSCALAGMKSSKDSSRKQVIMKRMLQRTFRDLQQHSNAARVVGALRAHASS
jgi:hypothetical protein